MIQAQSCRITSRAKARLVRIWGWLSTTPPSSAGSAPFGAGRGCCASSRSRVWAVNEGGSEQCRRPAGDPAQEQAGKKKPTPAVKYADQLREAQLLAATRTHGSHPIRR